MNRPPQNASAPPPPSTHEFRWTAFDWLAAAAFVAVIVGITVATSLCRSTSVGALPTPVAVTPVSVVTTATPVVTVQAGATSTVRPSLPPSTPTVVLPQAGNGGLLGGAR